MNFFACFKCKVYWRESPVIDISSMIVYLNNNDGSQGQRLGAITKFSQNVVGVIKDQNTWSSSVAKLEPMQYLRYLNKSKGVLNMLVDGYSYFTRASK